MGFFRDFGRPQGDIFGEVGCHRGVTCIRRFILRGDSHGKYVHN